ncbi:hypothetical protein M9H77_06459 [Catharanthus roseus]|uniref:Uncharacterized protein n=1 Tax=Catharanthus roseus TaxID=4058 RepID=A0ACC0BSC2_CATRO|nr:hypothetical protein M9H77_06459 [Catharanthus roseus]
MAFFSPPNADVPLETALSPICFYVMLGIISRDSERLVLSIEYKRFSIGHWRKFKGVICIQPFNFKSKLYVFRDHEEYITSRRNGRTPSPYILGNIDVEKELRALPVPATNVAETRGDANSGREVKKQKKTKFASEVPENMKLVYLRQSFIRELQKTEFYETKLIGTFVRVSSRLDDRKRMPYQLVQVTGVINEVRSIKLQLLGMPREISIDLLKERNFTEEEYDALRLKMNSGLIKKPTLNFAKEMRNIEAKIGHTNEKGYRYRYPFIVFSVEILPQSISGRVLSFLMILERLI